MFEWIAIKKDHGLPESQKANTIVVSRLQLIQAFREISFALTLNVKTCKILQKIQNIQCNAMKYIAPSCIFGQGD